MESKISKTQTRRLYRQVPNFSFVPPEYQKPPIFSRHLLLRLLIIMIIAVELFSIWSLYQEKSSLETAIDSAQQRIQQAEAKIKIVNAEEELKKERQALQDDWNALTAGETDWPQVLSAFLRSKPEEIELFSLKQDGALINASGATANYASLLKYRRALLSSPAISQIISLNSKLASGSISFSLSVEIERGGR